MRTIKDIITDAFGEYKEETRGMDLLRISGKSKLDFCFFTENILGFKWSGFHKELMQVIADNKYLLVIIPRGHYKTTLVSKCYAVWKLWRETNFEIMLVSSAVDQASAVLQEVQKMIEDNEFLNPLVPAFKEDVWNKSQMNTVNGNMYYIRPFNPTARGKHMNLLIADDILREENITQEQIKDYFWSIFFPEVQAKNGQLIMIGTPQSMTDLYAQIENPEPEIAYVIKSAWKVVRKAAVTVDEKGNWTASLFPEQYPMERLQNLRMQMGRLRFQREYMCNPLGSSASLFGGVVEDKFKLKPINKPQKGFDYYLGVDVAMSAGRYSDYAVFCILGKEAKTGNLIQANQIRDKGWGTEKIVAEAKRLHKIWKFRKIMIESSGVSVGPLKHLADMRLSPETSGIMVGFHGAHGKKEELLGNLHTIFSNSQLLVLDDPILMKELLSFGKKEDPKTGKVTFEGLGERDDTVMALALAAFSALEQTGIASFKFI